MKVNAMGQEESAGAEVVELAAVVTLDSLNGDPKLCANISKKIRKCGKYLGFEAKWKSPNVVRAVIKITR